MSDDKPTLAIDLDGTILRIDMFKWMKYGMEYFGTPMPYVRTALTELRNMGWRIIIHTCRLNPKVNTRGTMAEAKKKVENALKENNIPYDEVYSGIGKPLADYYIDDRAIKFEDWHQVLFDLGVKE